MRGHTPGPWRATDDAPTIIQCDYRSIGSRGGALIASAMGNDNSGFYVSESESLANARLIAAAPELLEALTVARTWLRGDKWRNSTVEKHASWEALMRGIDSAIAKATGATP